MCLLIPISGHATEGTSQEPLEWWGPEAIGQGYHIRVPVTVLNPHDYAIENGLVLAEIDLTEALVDAGWVHEVRGVNPRLSSFELDPNSVRVVEMFDLQAPEGGSKHGKIAAYDPSISNNDPTRFEVPSTHFEGFVQQRSDRAFDNKTNPILTVMWRIQDSLDPGDERYFVVYVDSLTNNEHLPRDYRGALGGDSLYNAFWAGAATELVGHAKPRDNGPAQVTVLGLHPDTAVRVEIADAGGSFIQQVPPANVHSNPFTIGDEKTVKVIFGNQPATFRLTANRPILALVDSEGFAPSKAGRFTGSEFLFATTYAAADQQDSLFIINQHPDLLSRPDQVATIVELQALQADGQPAGPAKQIHVSDGDNPFHYTLGYRHDRPTSTATCSFAETPYSPTISSQPTTYRARVTKGGPVAIQFDAVNGIIQVPDLDQGPTGTQFLPVLARKNHPQQPETGNCPNQIIEAYNVFATADQGVGVGVWSLDTPDRLFPTCNEEPCDLMPIGPIGQTADFLTIDPGPYADRPLVTKATGPLWLMAGRTSAQTMGAVNLHGPLGGHQGAREFRGFGESFVYAPYEDTRIQVTIGASGDAQIIPIAKGRAIDLSDATDIDVRGQWYEIASNRPVIVNPTTDDSGFLAGVPSVLKAETHEDAAEYRGYLVDIASKTGLNPVTASTVPGEPVQYEFVVTNKGRAIGSATLTDTIELCPTGAESLPPGWTVDVAGSTSCDSPSAITLASGAWQTIKMKVTPPDDAAVGDIVLGVLATSLNNPAVADSIGTVTHVKKSYAVGLWFDFAGQTGLKKKIGNPSVENASVEYKVVLRNDGSVEDTITLTMSEPESGWSALLDDEVMLQVTLGPKEVATFILEVDPPDGIAQGSMLTTLTAQSSVPSVLDRITAFTRVEAPSQISILAENDVARVQPGQHAIFNITARNDGTGVSSIFLETQHDNLPGWGHPEIYLRNTGTGELTPVDQLSLFPGQSAPLAVHVATPTYGDAGERSTTRLHAATDLASESRELFLYAIVDAFHNVTTQVVDSPIKVSAGTRDIRADVRIENKGNLNETFQILVAERPGGWSVDFPTPVIDLPRNVTQPVEIAVKIPAGTMDGTYNVRVRLVAQDGDVTEFTIPIIIGKHSDLQIEMPTVVAGQPGRTVVVTANATNAGNTPLRIQVQALTAEAWTTEATEEFTALPGETIRLRMGWLVPTTAADGKSMHEVKILAHGSSQDDAAVQHIARIEVDVQRPDLRIKEVNAFEGPAGRIIHAVIENGGMRPAQGIDVYLMRGGKVVDQLSLAEIEEGTTRNVTLLLPSGDVGPATLVLDLADQVIELDEGNNALNLDEVGKKESPGLPIALVLATAFGLAWKKRFAMSKTRR